MAGTSRMVMGGLQVGERCSACKLSRRGGASSIATRAWCLHAHVRVCCAQDELFNFTADLIKATAVQSRLEVKVRAGRRGGRGEARLPTLQHPSLLCPRSPARWTACSWTTRCWRRCSLWCWRPLPSCARAARRQTRRSVPVPSRARSRGATRPRRCAAPRRTTMIATARAACRRAHRAVRLRSRASSRSRRSGSRLVSEHASMQPLPSQALLVSNKQAAARACQATKQPRRPSLPPPHTGALDLMTDEAFLEALLSFTTSVPTADIWQDRGWREQQRRLLSAQFGPREVESLVVNAALTLPGEEDDGVGELAGWVGGLLGSAADRRGVARAHTDPHTNTLHTRLPNAAADALGWVVAKESRDLEVLHGQSGEARPRHDTLAAGARARQAPSARVLAAPPHTHTHTHTLAPPLCLRCNRPVLLVLHRVGRDLRHLSQRHGVAVLPPAERGALASTQGERARALGARDTPASASSGLYPTAHPSPTTTTTTLRRGATPPTSTACWAPRASSSSMSPTCPSSWGAGWWGPTHPSPRAGASSPTASSPKRHWSTTCTATTRARRSRRRTRCEAAWAARVAGWLPVVCCGVCTCVMGRGLARLLTCAAAFALPTPPLLAAPRCWAAQARRSRPCRSPCCGPAALRLRWCAPSRWARRGPWQQCSSSSTCRS